MSEPMPKLLPCPFCGSDEPTLYTTEMRGKFNGALIECRGCSVEVVSFSDEAVMAHWQARAEGLREDSSEFVCFGNTVVTTNPASVRRAALEEVAKWCDDHMRSKEAIRGADEAAEAYRNCAAKCRQAAALAPAPGEGK